MWDNYHQLPMDTALELLRVLASAGFTAEDIERIIKEQNLASTMYEAFQDMTAATGPSWQTSPERQLARAYELWPGIVLPEPPKEFPRTKSEVLLLHVPDTLDSLWSRVVGPNGYTTHVRWDERPDMRRAPHKREFTEPVWLAFNPEHGRGYSPDMLWDDERTNLAASEVLSALIQFPEWPLAWNYNGAAAPDLSGYQAQDYFDKKWSLVPAVECNRAHRRLELHVRMARCVNNHRSSPSVREC